MFYTPYFEGNRKDQHVELALCHYDETAPTDFTKSQFVHQSLPELKVDDVDISTNLAGLDLPTPFFINAMTGGSEQTHKINHTFATLSYLTGVPVASGSISAAIKDPSVAKSFQILRIGNPKGTIFANLGAHHDVENAKRAVDLLEADALQIHLNAPQEIVMPEGDRDFSMWLTNIEKIVKEVEVPVIVKEVGFGMSRETAKQLTSIGVKTIDVSGVGGTNFIKIESSRRILENYDFLSDWGQSALASMVEILDLPETERPRQLIASGGVKTPLDIVKALSIGADAVGLSGRFLKYGKKNYDIEEALSELQYFKKYIAQVMTLLGAKTVAELRTKDIILAPNVQNWCEARQVDWKRYANRSSK